MNTHRTIKATDIRVGDTIQWTTLVCGISAKWKMTVSRIAAGTVGNIEFFKVYNQQGGIRHFDADDEFYLVDRPAPKLPPNPEASCTSKNSRARRLNRHSSHSLT
ncbi:hypothetical protein [Staphylococcus aureus]|uniref:hypothetical protein n=1 Tax=Staphylococcus aureus TaxID=1280 RepID=UPI003219F3F5